MILFFQSPTKTVLAVEAAHAFSPEDVEKLVWAFSEAKPLQAETLEGWYVGPRREMITPWSTNAVEITQNMGLTGISRIEEYFPVSSGEAEHDPMLQRIYNGLNQDIFTISKQPDPIVYIEDIEAYNKQEGLALSDEEVAYLNEVSQKLERRLTDSEVYGFAQVNSEHCRHKIFGGTFIIDGEEKESSLFNLIKKTSAENPNKLVSAYKDNVAFNEGPMIEQFAPASGDKPDFYEVKEIKSVISLKAETHNFPTTVEPFNGAATGSGGEIRDRLGGGKSSLPIAGTAVYMTSYPRINGGRDWEDILPVRKWLYQTPEQILIKASNGASDFGNKFGQPLITGSVLTFEHKEGDEKYAYDKVIMLAGGVGFANMRDALKGDPEPGEKVVVIGGDICGGVDGRQLMLGRGHLIVLRLGQNTQLPELLIQIGHILRHTRLDSAEVMVIHLLTLGGSGTEQRAAAENQVLALAVHGAVHQEILLLGADRGANTFDIRVAKQLQDTHGLLVQGLHGAQQRGFFIQRLTAVGAERRGDTQCLVLDKGVRGRIPGGIAPGLEGSTQAAGGEGGGVGLAPDQLLAGELHDGGAVAHRGNKAIVLLTGDAGQRLEPVGVVGGTQLHGPALHHAGHDVCHLNVQRSTLVQGVLQALIGCARQALLHHMFVKDLAAVDFHNIRCHKSYSLLDLIFLTLSSAFWSAAMPHPEVRKHLNKNGAASQEVTHSAVAVYGLIIASAGQKGN